ncbi:polysaccharide deacetylase family protein [Neobacillus sp. SCS-31]|uniref:polysaccharide deacetylase family protein n=1 Tax=Neobacillus oceani TaxID=3115292 RepID=UPI003905D662
MMKKTIIAFCSLFILYMPVAKPTHANEIKRWKYEKTGLVFWEADTKEKLIALTFDDGPDPLYTIQILDAMKKYNAKGTFFVIGKEAERFPEILKRQAIEGHEIANHTYRHKFRDMKNPNVLKAELRKNSDLIKRITGKAPTLFRPIAGYYDEQIIETSIDNGYYVVLWTWHQDTRDWKKPGAKRIARNVLYDTKPGDIVILHDAGGDRSQTVKAVEYILESLYKRGYKCVTVSELLSHSNSVVPVLLLNP